MPDDSPTIGLRVVESLSAVAAVAMGRLRAGAGLGRQPVPQLPLPEGAGGFQVGRPADRLATAISAGRKRRRHPAGRRPALRERPQPGRIRLRPWLGAAFERAGGRYYPKLQVAVPFTPVPGPRLLARARPVRDGVRHALIEGLAEIAGDNRISSVHATFAPRPTEALRCARLAAAPGPQYHWTTTATDLRRFPGRPGVAQAQGHPQGTRGRRREGLTVRALTGARDQAASTGTPSSPSTWTPATANGARPI